MTEPNLEEWQALYEAADAFRQLAPWRWMTGEDLFAVEDPATRQVGYGSVMGEMGEEFGLALFLGPDGLAAYRRLWLDDTEPETMDAAVSLLSLVVTFGERAMLTARDLAVIRSLGRRYRGREVWPWLRSQRPGYVPWYLEAEECRFLQVALLQAMEVSTRVKDGTLVLTPGLDDAPLLTRVSRAGEWVDEWRVPEVQVVAPEEPSPVDELSLRQLSESRPHDGGTWQVDLDFVPTPIGSATERPYYPRLLLVVSELGFVIGSRMLEPWASADQLQAAMLALLEQSPQLPGEILVRRAEVRRLIAPLAQALRIEVEEDDLMQLEIVQESLLQFLA